MSTDYSVIRSRRRTLELRVYPDSRVEVRAPLRASRREIEEFVASRDGWLASRLARFAADPVPPESERFADGSRHPFLGDPVWLALVPPRQRARREADRLLLPVGDGDDWRKVQRALEKWYRAEAERDFAARLERLFPPFADRGHRRPALRIRRMRSRWGSLSVRTGMTLALELIKVPPECIDYVIVHELCHLEHMNHGPRFRALMTGMMPDWPARRRRLNGCPLR